MARAFIARFYAGGHSLRIRSLRRGGHAGAALDGGWELETARARYRARAVVVATGACAAPLLREIAIEARRIADVLARRVASRAASTATAR